MKKIILFVLLMMVFFFLYCYVSVVRNFIDQTLLPSTYNEYAYLYENKVESKDYRIIKIIDGSTYDDMLFHTGTEEFILEMPDSDYDRNNRGWKTYWKISKEGEVIDSLDTTAYMYDVGVFFDSISYIDWVDSGKKIAQKYQARIDFDTVSKTSFDGYVASAESITYAIDFENKKANCYLKIKDEWLVFESKKAYQSDIRSDGKANFGYEPKSRDSLIELTNRILPFQKWKDEKEFIYLERFVGEERQYQSFLDLNNTSRGGWNGTGYFRLTHNSEPLYFKSYTFKSDSYDSDLRLYDFQYSKGHSIKENDISFIIKAKNHNSNADRKEAGVFAIIKK